LDYTREARHHNRASSKDLGISIPLPALSQYEQMEPTDFDNNATAYR
jgi:hypothetical protein